MTVLDATLLSPIIRRVLSEREDRLFQRLEETLKMKPKTPHKSSPVLRRSPRINKENEDLFEETLISGDKTFIIRLQVVLIYKSHSNTRRTGIVINVYLVKVAFEYKSQSIYAFCFWS